MSAFLLSTPLLRSSSVATHSITTPRRRCAQRKMSAPGNVRATLSNARQFSENEGRPESVLKVSKNSDQNTNLEVSSELLSSMGSVYAVDVEKMKTDRTELLRAFMKTRASLDPTQEIVYHFTGTVYTSPTEGPAIPLFLLDAFSICRAIPIDGGGYRLLTREVALYLDLETKQPLTVFKNPITKVINRVVPVLNDPVNQQFLPDTVPLSTTDLSSGNVCFNCDVFPRYPTPLPLSEFPDVGSDEPMYSSAELFHFILPEEELQSSFPTTQSCAVTWSRIGPWLPWMCMRDVSGSLTYHCRGAKIPDGFNGLPEYLRKYVLKECPQFAHAPTEFTSPNETSWSYMRKLIEQKGFPRADGRIARRRVDSNAGLVHKREAPVSNNLETSKPIRGLTRRELRAFRRFDSSSDETPIYLCIAGKIFDVSDAPEHYGFGETYHCLTGCDATRVFLSGNLSNVSDRAKDESVVDLDSLSETEQKNLDGWVSWLSKKYQQVAVLLD